MATVFADSGKEWACDALAAAVATTGQFIAWGTGAGTAAVGDTTLFTEASEARTAGTVTRTGSGATSKWQNVGAIVANGTKTITNVGAFTASSVGSLIVKKDFTGIAVESGDTITFTITLQPT